MVAALWAGIGIVGLFAYIGVIVPDPLAADTQARPPNLTILAADGSILAERGLRRGHLPLGALPPHLIEAVLATEDRRFYSHWGMDPIGLGRAVVQNVRAQDIVQGGSTITQQLAKNLFLTPERTLWRKLQEVALAFWLEMRFGKDRILELYLNRVYFGAGAYGVEAAAQRYFEKSARQVTLAEAALLAGLLRAPSRYAPTRNPDRAEARAGQVLASMVDAGFLTSTEAVTALTAPARVDNPSGITGHEYAVDWVSELLPGFVGEQDADLVVETTVDARLQRAVQRAVGEALAKADGSARAGQAAAVVIDTEGRIRAIVGGRSYADSQYNRAVKALRQPGSAFKPFVYLAALEAGMTPDTLIEDSPVSVNGWSPRNYSGDYAGIVTLSAALARSINTVSVRLAVDVGHARVARTARRLGIAAVLHDHPSIALGTGEVNLVELTGAYVPFANGGRGVLAHIIARVRTVEGRVLYERQGSGPGQVVAAPHVGAMNEMLNLTLIEGTGTRAALPDRPAAGKTGTSQSFRDAWFVGYTANYVAGVWVGNDDGAPMRRVTGGGLPAAIWREIMADANRDAPVMALPGTYVPSVARQDERFGFAPAGHAPQPEKESFLRRVLGLIAPGR